MLIHGAWLTPSAWDRFCQRYEAAGMQVVAPAWPLLDRPVDSLRRAPDPRLGRLGLPQIADHYAALIEAMPHPPILIGHSFGGLIVQLLLDRGYGAAGVAIDPAPPFGVPAHPLAVWTSLGVFTAWNGWNRVLRMGLRGFSTGFAQTLPEAEKPYAYEKFVVPAPGRIFFQALLGIGSRVRWDNPDRAPLLLIAGEKDRTVPAPMVRATYRRHLKSPARTGFHAFAGRSHWLCNEDGWEEVADRALAWAVQHAR
jgi:pimeloyl-ACP methyl ester carboxylesterase